MCHRMFNRFGVITVAGSESSLFFSVINRRYVDRIETTHRPQLVRRRNREIGPGVFDGLGRLRQGIIQVMLAHERDDPVEVLST
jgi:hypothetical protein